MLAGSLVLLPVDALVLLPVLSVPSVLVVAPELALEDVLPVMLAIKDCSSDNNWAPRPVPDDAAAVVAVASEALVVAEASAASEAPVVAEELDACVAEAPAAPDAPPPNSISMKFMPDDNGEAEVPLTGPLPAVPEDAVVALVKPDPPPFWPDCEAGDGCSA
jgi:hypothetical protein